MISLIAFIDTQCLPKKEAQALGLNFSPDLKRFGRKEGKVHSLSYNSEKIKKGNCFREGGRGRNDLGRSEGEEGGELLPI